MAKRETVEQYKPPPKVVDLAKRRTRGIRTWWGRWGEHSLAMLCASCYLQGIEDTAQALDRRPVFGHGEGI